MVSHEVLPQVDGRKPRFFYGYIIALAGFFVLMVAYGTQYSFGVFFKPVLNDFGWTRAMMAGAYSVYGILLGVFSIVAGRLSDRFGPRLVVTACGFFLGLGYVLVSQISALWQLYLFYGGLASLGMSGSSVPLLSTIARWFIKGRGLMTGILVSGIGIGIIIMPPVANHLITTYGWRTSYLVIGSIALVLIMVAAQFLRREPSQGLQFAHGSDSARVESVDSGAKGFSLWEAIHTSQFWILCVLYFFFNFALQTVMIHTVPHATDIGIPAASAAGILSFIGGLSIVGRIGLGSAGDRMGNKPALVISLILLSAGLLWLQLVRELWMFYLFAIIFGFGYGGVIVLQSPLIAESFGLGSHGVILGVVIFSATAGGAVGPLVAGRIFDVTNSYRLGFLISVVLSVTSLILALVLKAGRGGEKQKA